MHVDTNSLKLKVDQNFLGKVGSKWCSQSGDRTLKLTIPQEGTEGVNRIFECRYKFRKGKSCFSDFWLGDVKNSHHFLVHEAVKCVLF